MKIACKYFVVSVYAMLAIGCSTGSEESVQRTSSPGGRFWAEISVDRGSALKYDWYSVALGKLHPGAFAVLPRQRYVALCSLQGPGKLSMMWKDKDSLVITCTGCSPHDFYVFTREWNGIQVKYSLE